MLETSINAVNLTDVAFLAPVIIALVEATKQAVPIKFHGLATIIVAVLFGMGLSALGGVSWLEGIMSSLGAVGLITYKRAGLPAEEVTK